MEVETEAVVEARAVISSRLRIQLCPQQSQQVACNCILSDSQYPIPASNFVFASLDLVPDEFRNLRQIEDDYVNTLAIS
jgi:hypothetical protein